MRVTRASRRAIRRRHTLAVGLIGVALAALFLLPVRLYADHSVTITGRVVNGTAGGAAPSDLEVVLHIISDGERVDVTSSRTGSEGRFNFQGVESDAGAIYALTASYQDVLYSVSLDPAALEDPVEVLVYETTSSLEDLHIDADVLLIRESKKDSWSLSAFEVVSLVNEGDRTFVPDLDQPGSMNFLRFPLPAGSTNLEVRSDLSGGEIITVGRGFALTAPVTPGSHQVTYTYRLPYRGSQVELTHSFPMGSDSFRLLIEDELGDLRSPVLMTPLPATELEGKSYQVWGTGQLSPGTRLNLELGDLPQPPAIRRLGDALTEGPYLKTGIPAALGLVLAGLLLYTLVVRRSVTPAAASPSHEAVAPLPSGDVLGLAGDYPADSVESATPPRSERHALMEAIARLDDLFQRGETSPAGYRRHRQELKERLFRLALISETE